MGPGFSRNVEPMEVDLDRATQKFENMQIDGAESGVIKTKAPERRVTFSNHILKQNRPRNEGSPSSKQARNDSHSRSNSGNRMQTPVADTPSAQCQYCGLSDHYAVNCYKRLRDEDRCFHCRKVGHHQNQCWSLNQNDNPNRKRAFRRFEQQNEHTKPKFPGYRQPRKNYGKDYDGQAAERFHREGFDRSNAEDRNKLLSDVKEFSN